MGGLGSGRWNRSGMTTVERCASIVLDINVIVREARKRADRALGWSLTINGAPQRIVMQLCLDLSNETGELHLWYDIAHATVGTGLQSYSVAVTAAPCHLGGRRWFFHCPATGRRVVKLYLPNGGQRFLCRQAYRMGYQSQRTTATGRAWGVIRKVDQRLGVTDGGPSTDPVKPKWMRWATYRRLCARRDRAEAVLDAELCREGERLLARMRA